MFPSGAFRAAAPDCRSARTQRTRPARGVFFCPALGGGTDFFDDRGTDASCCGKKTRVCRKKRKAREKGGKGVHCPGATALWRPVPALDGASGSVRSASAHPSRGLKLRRGACGAFRRRDGHVGGCDFPLCCATTKDEQPACGLKLQRATGPFRSAAPGPGPSRGTCGSPQRGCAHHEDRSRKGRTLLKADAYGKKDCCRFGQNRDGFGHHAAASRRLCADAVG